MFRISFPYPCVVFVVKSVRSFRGPLISFESFISPCVGD
jgi:hypothetical protein